MKLFHSRQKRLSQRNSGSRLHRQQSNLVIGAAKASVTDCLTSFGIIDLLSKVLT